MLPAGFQNRSRWVRWGVHHFGELLHLCATYFGIAALMILLSMLLVPSTRDQTRQIYASVIDTFRPASWTAQRFLAVPGLSGPERPQSDWAGQAQTTMGDREGSSLDFSGAYPMLGGVVPWQQAPIGQGLDEHSPDQQDLDHQTSAYSEFAQSLEVASNTVRLAGVSEAQYQALRSYIARKYKVAYTAVGALIDIAYREAQSKKLDPLLILAVMAIESSYNPFAESGVGAQGLMQIMTKVHQEKFEPFSEGTLAVFSPDANIQVGTQILADCLQRRGSLAGALACYVGATGPSDGGYGKRVLAERSRIALASGIAIQE